MSTGGSGADSGRLFSYGTSTAGPNVDLTASQARGMTAGDDRDAGKPSKASSIMETLKEALKPGDSRRSETETAAMGDTTHDGRHGGIVETMKPGSQDYDVREEHHRNNSGNNMSSSSGGGSGWGVIDTVKQALGKKETHRDATGATGSALKSGSGQHYGYDNDYDNEYPSTGSPKGAFGRGSELGDRAVPKVAAFDSQGSVGHQFTTEGSIGSVGQKVGGPFSKEGVVGKQFTDSGAVGGTVQDTLGHGNVTRKGN